MGGGSAQVVQKWWVYMLLFLFPFQVECSSVNIIIMVKNTVSQRHAITYVNHSKDIFATQVRWNVINIHLHPQVHSLHCSLSCDLYCICPKQLWATERGMVFKVVSLKQDKNFTINFSILNRVSFCSGNLTLCPDSDPHPISPNSNTALGLSLRAGGWGFSPHYYECGPGYFRRKKDEK